MIMRIKEGWRGSGGCGEVLRVAFPLILSTSAHTVQMFVDRVYLTHHSIDEMSAALPAGIAAFVFVSFFMGTAGYVNTFVAQYVGAGRPERVGPSVWQGIYFSLLAGVVMLAILPLAQSIFDWFGHDAEVRQQEVIYFKLMCLNVTPVVIGSAVSCFFTGRTKTWTVFAVNGIATVINIVLDYVLIFGKWGFPEMGIAGAGLATIIASVAAMVMFVVLFLRKRHRFEFASLSGARPDVKLFWRLMRFGLPNGVHFMLDILAFTLVMAFIGRIDKTSLAATNIAFQINMLAFMPMVGFGIALTTLVGQAIGRNNPALAQRSTWSAFYMTFIYMSLVGLGYWLMPDWFIAPFKARAYVDDFASIVPLTVTLLRFVAFYCLFDTGNVIFSAALKGAGDTRFVMLLSATLHWAVMVIPTWIAVKYEVGPGGGLYAVWTIITIFVCVLSAAFLLRFLGGKWKTMKVIETAPGPVPGRMPEVPTVEIEAS